MHDREQWIGQNVTLVFRTIHLDRAGQSGSTRIIQAEIAGLHTDGTATLVSNDGVHIKFPIEQITNWNDNGYIGGQELIRDFHNEIAPFSLRCLDRRDLQHEMSDTTNNKCSD